MLPDNTFSDTAHIAGFTFPVKTPAPVDKLQDWELGGVGLNDPSQGLMVKVWHCLLEIDRDTGVGSVYVEAPGWPKDFLFSGAGISEVAMAFDQNMNPFIAYMQGADAKIYWYDPTATAMVHTTLPAGSYDLRCSLDDKRQFNVGDSDIILSYIRAGTLYMRYQRDRYAVEYTLKTGIGSTANLVSMAMNAGSRMQWRLRNYARMDDPNALIQVEPFLADVVGDLCRRSGLRPDQFDVNELYDDVVPGLRVASDEGYHEQIDWLRDMFIFDKANIDKKVHFRKRNRDVVARIPYSDLVATSPQTLQATLADEQKLPREININHIDPDGGYAKNKQTAARRSNLVNARKKETIDSQLVLTADQAATVALTKLKMYWGELVDYKFSTTLKYTALTPTCVIEVEDAKGVWHRMQIRERNEDGKIIEWEATQHGGQRVYGSKVYGNALKPPTSTTPGLVGPTRLELLNLPALATREDELGLYIAAAGATAAWSGYQLLYSIDEGTTYTEAFTVTSPSLLGDTLTQLEEEPAGYVYPSSQTVEVLVNYPLQSVSYDQLMLRKNLCVIGDELLQYQTAELLEMVGPLYRYRLSGLLRGRLYMPAETWPAGTRFVFIDGTVVFAPVERAYLGMDLWYKAVSLGHNVDETTPLAYLYEDGVSQREFPVSNVQAVRVGGDVTVSWIGAARFGFDTAPYHSKYFRGYRVKFSNGHTIDTMAEVAVYPAAPAGVTVQVCALNEITGEGPPSPAIPT